MLEYESDDKCSILFDKAYRFVSSHDAFTIETITFLKDVIRIVQFQAKGYASDTLSIWLEVEDSETEAEDVCYFWLRASVAFEGMEKEPYRSKGIELYKLLAGVHNRGPAMVRFLEKSAIFQIYRSSYFPYDMNEDDLALFIKEFIREVSIAFDFLAKTLGRQIS